LAQGLSRKGEAMLKKYLIYVIILCIAAVGSLVLGAAKKSSYENRGGPRISGTTPDR
jgi:hypothetical protein